MSTTSAMDATMDADRQAFLAKRRAARKVKSRKKRATGGRGAGGVQEQAGLCADMDSLPSQNLAQKDLTPPVLTSSTTPTIAGLFADSTPNELQCTIYAKPPNPRLLLVQFADKTCGKVVIRPAERLLFGPGKRIWVKAVERGLYVLAGRYNRFGARV